jgi:chromosome segregation ATPase
MASNDVSPEAMQSRIQQARREAESLKDRIKRKKDDLADATREYNHQLSSICLLSLCNHHCL